MLLVLAAAALRGTVAVAPTKRPPAAELIASRVTRASRSAWSAGQRLNSRSASGFPDVPVCEGIVRTLTNTTAWCGS